MTRLYIELSSEDGELVPKSVANQEYVMKKAREIMHPFRLEWKSVGESGLNSALNKLILTA